MRADEVPIVWNFGMFSIKEKKNLDKINGTAACTDILFELIDNLEPKN